MLFEQENVQEIENLFFIYGFYGTTFYICWI